VGVLALVATVGLWRTVAAQPPFKTYYPAYVACLDAELGARGLRYGTGDFWLALQTSMLSRSGLQVSQLIEVGGQLRPHLWTNTVTQYSLPVEYVLAFEAGTPAWRIYPGLQTISPTAIVSNLGQPEAIIRCEGVAAYLYPLSANIAGRFRTDPRLAHYRNADGSFVWE
jgi:hypothetical protein